MGKEVGEREGREKEGGKGRFKNRCSISQRSSV